MYSVLFRGSRGNDARTQELSNLDGGGADATGRAQHQQDFVGLERAALGKRVERGQVVGAESGGNFRRDAVGDRGERRCRHEDVFGKRAGPRHAHHPIP